MRREDGEEEGDRSFALPQILLFWGCPCTNHTGLRADTEMDPLQPSCDAVGALFRTLSSFLSLNNQ